MFIVAYSKFFFLSDEVILPLKYLLRTVRSVSAPSLILTIALATPFSEKNELAGVRDRYLSSFTALTFPL